MSVDLGTISRCIESVAISAASAFGNPYTPVERAGKAMLFTSPSARASAKLRSYAERRSAGSSRRPADQIGPTAWMTYRARNLNPGVIAASPGAHGARAIDARTSSCPAAR